MSILINMEMPKNGDFVEVLIWSDGHVTQTGDSYKDENGRAYYKPCDWKYFSAVELQPHGDLIDRDAFKEYVCHHCDGYCDICECDCLNCKSENRCSFIQEMDDAPTIIEAEVK